MMQLIFHKVFPDFAPPKEITDRLAEVAKMGPHQYAITWGATKFS